MRTTIPSFLLALTLAGTLGLAGCGSDDTDDASSSDETTSATEESEGATEETEPAAPETEAETETEPAEEGDGDKPSREDVIAGYEQIVTAGTTELPDEIVTKTVTCFVDEVYDAASAQTLQAIADADVANIDPADASLFGDAGVTCAQAGAS